MADIVERLRFDEARCEMQFSKGVAGNIKEAADEIERLRAALREITETPRDSEGYCDCKDLAHTALTNG